jgi:HSP20 family molecular chaperone IbpA
MMARKKCPSCNEKISKKFEFCPYCGVDQGSGLRDQSPEDFGMLGKNDSAHRIEDELKLPFGMNKIMNSLVKQLEKHLGSMDIEEGKMPKGIQIRVARGPGQMRQSIKKPDNILPIVSREESDRRVGLPRIEVESKVRRLGDSVIYEIETPGVKKKDDVVLTELATGLEVKAYSKDKCYVKFIPLKVEVVRYSVEKEKVFVEIRG